MFDTPADAQAQLAPYFSRPQVEMIDRAGPARGQARADAEG